MLFQGLVCHFCLFGGTCIRFDSRRKTFETMFLSSLVFNYFWGSILPVLIFLGLENQAQIGMQVYEVIRTIVPLVNYHASSATSTKNAEDHLVFSFLISMYLN